MKFLKWKNIKRELKFFVQRRTRGFDDSELWSLDVALAKLIYPRLKALKERTCGYPSTMTEEKWDEKLQRMIDGFEYIAKGKMWDWDDKKSTEEKIAEKKEAYKGVKLFGKHFGALWS